jgi:hypothetical protein
MPVSSLKKAESIIHHHPADDLPRDFDVVGLLTRDLDTLYKLVRLTHSLEEPKTVWSIPKVPWISVL